MTDAQILKILDDYETEKDAAHRAVIERRDERLRRARDSGRTQSELITITGWSREAMRQALTPGAREAAREKLREARAKKRESTP